MAAQEDSESHREFPVASFSVPSRSEQEERVVLALNAKDGQQSCTQDAQDPYTRALEYVEKHRIVEIFQIRCLCSGNVAIGFKTSIEAYLMERKNSARMLELLEKITSRIAYEKPAKPLQFMLDEIEKVQKGQTLEALK